VDAEEARRVGEELRGIAERHGLSWLAEQVDDIVREGKPEFKRPVGRQAREPGELVPPEIAKSRGILASEPYSEQERAGLLVAAMRRAIRDSAAVERASAAMLIDSEVAESVEFVDELGLEPPHDLHLDREISEEQSASRERLVVILDTLEARIISQEEPDHSV
jgi:hypothetical protein